MNELVQTENTGVIPPVLQRIHILGVCGTGMAALAGMLKQRGYTVTGSDMNVYPPMSDFLRELHIEVKEGYKPENLDPRPDLVVVGNVIRRENPEAVRMRELNIPHVSFPQILSKLFIQGRQSVVVCGTHGKTSTSSLMAWILEYAGRDPSFMIGGIAKNFMKNYKVGNGGFFVAEGDEYDTAYFDKGPKFLHYQPRHVILTSVEFDHADIYRDLDHVKSAFRRLLSIIPDDGFLMACAEDKGVADVLRDYSGKLQTYGLDGSNADWTAELLSLDKGTTRFLVRREGDIQGEFTAPFYGRHNMLNGLAAIGLSNHLGLDMDVIGRALSLFQGVKRRQEVRGVVGGITIIDDFAHHPTEVRETVAAVRAAYSAARLIAVFEPRTNTSRQKFFQKDYIESFAGADYVLVREPPDPEKFGLDNSFSSKQLSLDIEAKGGQCRSFPRTEEIIDFLTDLGKPGDVILIMSNGGFDNIHDRLLAALAAG